jgi:apolipoprotein D and lipocalin family protein
VLVALAAGAVAAGASDAAPPTTVAHVELDRYAGLWYEISRIPNSFQRSCVDDTTARYSLRADGRLNVINRCLTADGSVDEARGVARVVDPNTNAKLEVSFVQLFGWHLFWGDYWIIGLDPDYRYAVIGHPKRRYGWVLARTPTLDAATRKEIDTILREHGYDPRRFEASPRTVTKSG